MAIDEIYLMSGVVRAVECSSYNFQIAQGKEIDKSEENMEGYTIICPEGYQVWCPKNDFESIARRLSGNEISSITGFMEALTE